MAEKILSSYPDYGKSPATYTAGIIEAIAHYPASVQAFLADPITGIRARCAYLPTIADVVKMASEATDRDNERVRVEDLARRVALARQKPITAYKSPERVLDARNNEITPRAAAEIAERHRQDVASLARVARQRAFILELGDGDGLKGWQIAIERGIEDVPADWKPKTEPGVKTMVSNAPRTR